MAENSKIEWCHHTFNPWVGCTRISPACDHCYAESWAKRTGSPELWQGDRRRTASGNWKQPVKWNALAAAAGRRDRVFCASLADVFDNQIPPPWRTDLFRLITATPALDWMLLTKRPQNIGKMIEGFWSHGLPTNVWAGTTIEDRARLVNADHLRRVPAAIRFLSIEPLLEDLGELNLAGIHLVIVGGESGPGARPMHPAWVRSIRDQCAAAGVAFLFKQWGEYGPCELHPVGTATCSVVAMDGRHLTGRDAVVGAPEDANAEIISRFGKKLAGRILDGRIHDGMPASPAAAA